MHDITIVYWRDIPAQVIVGKGRRGAKRPLSERFEQAIDRCAMRSDAKDTDAYLAEWRKVREGAREGVPENIVAEEVARLESAYGAERLRALVEQGGWQSTSDGGEA